MNPKNKIEVKRPHRVSKRPDAFDDIAANLPDEPAQPQEKSFDSLSLDHQPPNFERVGRKTSLMDAFSTLILVIMICLVAGIFFYML
jgi:hypothetical protein